VNGRAGRYLDRPEALAAINTVSALLRGSVDEGDAAGSALYGPTMLLLDALETCPVWPALYARWELGLLSALGFGLDLDQCALSGENDGLTHVSPKTGRAVRGSEAEGYVDRLFPLPAFLIDPRALAMAEDIEAALRLTGYFLEERLFSAVHKPIPEVRARLFPKLIG